jgi:hypothetical protein
MPILRQHHMVEVLREPVDNGHDRIAIGHGQRATRAEIILHIDDQQHVIRFYLHVGLTFKSRCATKHAACAGRRSPKAR